jgi:V-type H+-transporting ATPase subunit E
METNVLLQCRQKDASLCQKAAQEAKSIYEKKVKSPVTIQFDQTFLPEAANGGVILSVLDGRIKLVNTLENRLELLSEKVCIFMT